MFGIVFDEFFDMKKNRFNSMEFNPPVWFKNNKPLKNFGGSRGSKGQGSNPNNRINDSGSVGFRISSVG